MSNQIRSQATDRRRVLATPSRTHPANVVGEQVVDAGALEHDSWFERPVPGGRESAAADNDSAAISGHQIPKTTTARSADMNTPLLFERLGGSAGINQLVERIVVLHMDNPAIRARFRPYLDTPDKLAITKKHLCAFLEAGSGGKAQYCGRSMLDTHRGMNISEAEYMAALDDILQAMRQTGIDEQTQKDVLAIAYSLKGEIIRV
jgi:hemoglobin